MTDYPQITTGISRNMQLNLIPTAFDTMAPMSAPASQNLGGGNLNGTQNTAHMMGHAGTGADRVSLPRHAMKVGGGNYCGVV